MSEVQVFDCFSYVSWFLRVQTSRLTFTYSAESTVACANVAGQHERCSAIRPAFEDVWTTSFLANCVEIQSLDKVQNLVLIRRITQTDPQPFGFRLTDFLII